MRGMLMTRTMMMRMAVMMMVMMTTVSSMNIAIMTAW